MSKVSDNDLSRKEMDAREMAEVELTLLGNFLDMVSEIKEK